MSIEDLTSLTSKDRILLYLSDYLNMEERFELPAGLTQESISLGTGVQRKHLSQYLKDLLGDGLVQERKAHIQGMKQRMNGYYLTSGGLSKAKDMRGKVEQFVVPVHTFGKVIQMKVADIDESTSHHITLCDIVCSAISRGSLDMSELEETERKRRTAVEREDQATESYRRALQTAWSDGKVTATERFLVEELRKQLKITDEQHRALEEEIVKKLAMDHMEFRRIYRIVLEVALADKVISGPEEDILEGLRRVMRISRKEHEELMKEVETSICGPQPEEKDLLKKAMRLVRDQVGE
jgi:hypothetical protein